MQSEGVPCICMSRAKVTFGPMHSFKYENLSTKYGASCLEMERFCLFKNVYSFFFAKLRFKKNNLKTFLVFYESSKVLNCDDLMLFQWELNYFFFSTCPKHI